MRREKAPVTGALAAVLNLRNSGPGLSAFSLLRKTQTRECQAQQGEARRFRNAGGFFEVQRRSTGTGPAKTKCVELRTPIGAGLKVTDIQVEGKTSGPATACSSCITQQRIDTDTEIVPCESLVWM